MECVCMYVFVCICVCVCMCLLDNLNPLHRARNASRELCSSISMMMKEKAMLGSRGKGNPPPPFGSCFVIQVHQSRMTHELKATLSPTYITETVLYEPCS